MNKHSISRNVSVPCQEFEALIKNGEYGYLFEEYAARTVHRNEYNAPMGGKSCQLIVKVGNMQLLFDSNSRDGDPTGQPLLVSESDLSPKDPRWLSPVQLSNFITGRWSRYINANEPMIGFESAAARRRTFETLFDFFNSGEYKRRETEFKKWSEKDDTQFMQQVYDRSVRNPFNNS